MFELVWFDQDEANCFSVTPWSVPLSLQTAIRYALWTSANNWRVAWSVDTKYQRLMEWAVRDNICKLNTGLVFYETNLVHDWPLLPSHDWLGLGDVAFMWLPELNIKSCDSHTQPFHDVLPPCPWSITVYLCCVTFSSIERISILGSHRNKGTALAHAYNAFNNRKIMAKAWFI